MLVFLHHGLGSVAQWRDFPRQLSEATGLPYFAYDRPGHGLSPDPVPLRTPAYLHQEAQILDRQLRAHDIEDFILIGHSDGGSIALLYPAVTGRQPRAIITEAAHLFVEERTLEGVRQVVAADLAPRLARYHGAKAAPLLAAWSGIWLSEEFRSLDLTGDVEAVRCPVLALQGADDEFGTPAQLDAIRAHVKGPVEIALIPDCRHEPHHEAPEATLALMKQAVLRWQAPSGPAKRPEAPS